MPTLGMLKQCQPSFSVKSIAPKDLKSFMAGLLFFITAKLNRLQFSSNAA